MAGKTIVRYEPGRKYVVKSNNPDYNGETYGLKFRDGEVTIDPERWKNGTGRDIPSVLEGIQQDFPDGYTIEKYGTLTQAVPDMDHLRTKTGRLRTKADAAEVDEEPDEDEAEVETPEPVEKVRRTRKQRKSEE